MPTTLELDQAIDSLLHNITHSAKVELLAVDILKKYRDGQLVEKVKYDEMERQFKRFIEHTSEHVQNEWIDQLLKEANELFYPTKTNSQID